MKTQIHSISDRGAYRPNNEDSFKYGECFNGELIWLIIADGMGGHLAGEVASQILVDEIERSICSIDNPESVDWLCWLEIEINRANNKILLNSHKKPEQKGMGTTGVVAIIYAGFCYLGWVGDSRCYLYEAKNNHLAQLTVDHTMVQALLDKGAITQKEADTSNNKNMLSKAIGIRKGVEVDVKSLPIHISASLLLSTDGLHDSLSSQELSEFMQSLSAGDDVCQKMVERAIKNGSKDNITLVSIKLLSE